MKSKSQPLNVRLPHGMRDRIRQRAAANRRSMNAEIVHYLDCALGAQEAKGPAEAATSPSHVTHQLPA
ncbi:Arc family DNA-binding protein [Aminobacter sp. P9b]|uniref:Arc family DNA-binding protein n=1 Tax=Aminobacter sp. P9b TaxID=3133697 RepID=UPI00324C1E85